MAIFATKVWTAASITVALALVGAAGAARADVPGPKPVCDASASPACQVCWQSYGGGGDNPAFDQCAAPLRDKGFVEACRNRQGAGDNVWFCPQGIKMETKVTGGGCAGCAVSDEGAGGLLALMASMCAIAALRRRRHSR